MGKSKKILIAASIALLIFLLLFFWLYVMRATVIFHSDTDVTILLNNKEYLKLVAGTEVKDKLKPGNYEISAICEENTSVIEDRLLEIKSWSETDSIIFRLKSKVQDENDYAIAKKENSIASYKKYIQANPKGKFVDDANKVLSQLTGMLDTETMKSDSISYEIAKQNNNIKSLEKYIKENPRGIFVNEANNQIAKIKALDKEAYDKAKATNTGEAYEKYIKEFPEGVYVVDAKKSILSIMDEKQRKEKDIQAFKAAQDAGTIFGYQEYLKIFPNGEFVHEATTQVKVLTIKAEQEKLAKEDNVWQVTKSKNKLDDYLYYLSEYPTGKYIKDARTIVEILEREKKYQSMAPPGFVYVDGGSFEMGSNKGSGDESPIHKVAIKSYYISKFEVTNADFAKFLNAYGSDIVKSGDNAGQDIVYPDEWGVTKVNGKWMAQPGFDKFPAVYVSWFGANEYCKYYGYRLPTEAEWEFASRGGNKSKGYKYSGGNDPEGVSWYYGNSSSTKPVGTRMPNELGIYDMTGNVWEWCWDWHEKNYYSNSPGDNPKGPASGNVKVLRGGSFFEITSKLRLTYRDFSYPMIGYHNYGFRCVKEITVK